MVSMGLSGSAVSGLRYSVARLTAGITRSLFLEDAARHFESLTSYDEPELVGAAPVGDDE